MTKYNLIEFLDIILETKTFKEIADELNVAIGTVKRWKQKDSIPSAYSFELLEMANIEIDYSKFTFSEKDQFFTSEKIAKKCNNTFLEIIKDYEDDISKFTFIEPSAGNGVFLKLFPENRRIGIDIEPRFNEIIKKNYLKWKPEKNTNNIIFGNPPFGLRGQLALKFINHSYEFADYVCFILPPLFNSDGKGSPRKRVKGYNLIYSEMIDSDFESPNKKPIKINCIFQIWSKYHKNDKYNIKTIDESEIKIYSLSDGKNSSEIRNKKMFDKCDIYIPSTCFGKDNMKLYLKFKDLPNNRGYGIVFKKNKEYYINIINTDIIQKKSFLSTNSAYNIRKSQIMEIFQNK